MKEIGEKPEERRTAPHLEYPGQVSQYVEIRRCGNPMCAVETFKAMTIAPFANCPSCQGTGMKEVSRKE